MTLNEIAERLKFEFPNEYSNMSIQINVHSTGRVENEITLYTRDTGNVVCMDLEDGIQQLKALRGQIQPNIEVTL